MSGRCWNTTWAELRPAASSPSFSPISSPSSWCGRLPATWKLRGERAMNSSKSKIGTFVLGWGAALILFFPILWMLLTGFKTESEAIVTPPSLFFSPTLENYYAVFERADYMSFAINSIVISVVATALAILIAVPAAYAMAFFPTERTRGTLLWMLSTKMMPPVGVLVPMYLLFRDFGLLDTRTGLIIIYTLMNLPIVIWMLYTFFKEVPELLLPLALPGIASTALLS